MKKITITNKILFGIALLLMGLQGCKKTTDVVVPVATTQQLADDHKIQAVHMYGTYSVVENGPAYGFINIDIANTSIYGNFPDLSTPFDIYKITGGTIKTYYGKMPVNYDDGFIFIKLSILFDAGKNFNNSYSYNSLMKDNKSKYKITYTLDDPIALIQTNDNLGLEIGLQPLKIGKTKLNILVQYTPTSGQTFTQVNQSVFLEII